MGNLAKSLENALLKGEPQQTVPIVPGISHHSASDDSAKIKGLSGMPLAYAFAETIGGKLVGNPATGFAFMNDETENLIVVRANDRGVDFVTLEQFICYVAMVLAKDEQATFIVHGDEVICSIRGFSASGHSYNEAAMRALLAQRKAELAINIPQQKA